MIVNVSRKTELADQIGRLRAELQAITDAEEEVRQRQLVGRAFRYRNCYSLPESESDYWWSYRLVLSTDAVLAFDVDCHGKISVERDTRVATLLMLMAPMPGLGEGWQEISRADLDRAWTSLMERLRALAPVVGHYPSGPPTRT